jgi:hypothetical protein
MLHGNAVHWQKHLVSTFLGVSAPRCFNTSSAVTTTTIKTSQNISHHALFCSVKYFNLCNDTCAMTCVKPALPAGALFVMGLVTNRSFGNSRVIIDGIPMPNRSVSLLHDALTEVEQFALLFQL